MSNGDQAAPVPTPAQVISIGAALIQQGVILPSFAQFAVTGEDNLRIISACSQAAVTINVHGRFLDAASGKVLPFSYTIPATSDRSPRTDDFPLGTGYLLNVSVFASGAPGLQLGECYTLVALIRGLGGGTILLGTLIAGYITLAQPLGWPGSPIQYSVDGPGAVETYTAANPAPGAEVSLSVPASARWELLSASVVLSTSAQAGNRIPFLQISHTGFRFFISGAPGTQAPSLFDIYAWGQGVPSDESNDLSVRQAPLPVNLRLLPADLLQTNSTALQTLDQYTNFTVRVREWIVMN